MSFRIAPHRQYDAADLLIRPPDSAKSTSVWRTKCPMCGCLVEKQWHQESDLCRRCGKIETDMHYRNGREAKEGDPVVVKDYNRVRSGTIHSLNAGATSCNAQVSYPVPGAVYHACVTVGDCWHAEDALASAEASLPNAQEAKPQAA